MSVNKNRKVYEARIVNNFRELVQYSTTHFKNNIAYKYKKDSTAKEVEYIEKTYEQVGKDIKAFSTSLLNRNLKKKKIALIGNNRYEWCVSYLAITCGNMVVVPLDKALPDNEIENLIVRSEAEVVIFDKKYLNIMKKIKEEKKNLKTLISMDNVRDKDVEIFNNLLEEGNNLLEDGDNKYEKIKIDENKMSIMLFTSGTTSSPKAVMLSQKNICSDVTNVASFVKIYPKDTLLSFLPIHHTFECTITFLYGFYSGATVAFCDGLKHIQKNMKEYKVSILVAVPLVLETMYKKIKKTIREKGKTELINKMIKISNKLLKIHIDLRKIIFKQIIDNFGGNLRVVFYGAAPMNKETIIGFNNFGIDLIQGYGLTETSPVISAETDKEKRPGSVGLVLDDLEVKISNKDKDGIGEILIKGPSVMLGYYKNEKATKEAFEDGWFKTGDYGYLDEDEFLYLTGRKKDIIVLRNGKNVYPEEIEMLINQISYVKESLVYQRGQSTTDTMLCAKIVYDEDLIENTVGKKTENEYKEEIWKQVKEINKNLPVFKHIKKIEITTDEFDKTTTHKVKRYKELEKVSK